MKIALLGDIALIGRYDRSVDANVNQRLLSIKKLLSDCDFVIANQESVLTDVKHTKACKGVYLRSNKKNVETLKYLGVTHVTLANNHIYDYGKKGALDTENVLLENNIVSVGLSTKPALLIKENDRVMLDGFCCYTANALKYGNKTGKVHLLDYEQLLNFFHCAEKEKCLPIVSAHFGLEGLHYPSQEHLTLFRSLAKKHDFVLHGNHPHAIQGCEIYGHSLLAYALGDFCFDDCDTTSINRIDEQTDSSRSSCIIILDVNGKELVDYEIKYITDLPDGYLRENSTIKPLAEEYSTNLKLSYQAIELLRNEEIKQQLKKRESRDLRFFINRMNYKYIGAYINGKIHAKKYKKLNWRLESTRIETD